MLSSVLTLAIYVIILCVFLYFLIHFNNLYKALAREKCVPYRIGAVLQYFIVYWPLVIVTAIFSLVCKFISKIILKLRFGEEIKYFIDGQDSLYIDKHPQKAVVPVLFLVKYGGSSEQFLETMQQYFFNCISSLKECKQIFGTMHSWNGCHFIMNNSTISINTRKCITKLRVLPNKDIINRNELLNLLEEYYADSQSYKAMWRILIGAQPVLWSSQQDCTLYPVLVHFSHCLFDETNFMKILLRAFGDDKRLYTSSPATVTSTIWPTVCSPCKMGFKIVHKVYQFCKYTYKGLPLAIVNSDLLQFKRNVLVGAGLGNRKFFCLGRSDAALTLTRTNMLGNQYNFKTSLSCILETAIIASLSEFYRKYSYANLKREQNLVYITTIFENFNCLSQKQIEKILSERSKTSSMNEVRFMCLNSPILESLSLEKPEDLVSLLEHISSLKDFLWRYGEPEITQNISSGVYNNFPKFLQKLILSHQISPQTIVSQLSGPSSKIKINGLDVENMYGWCPNFGKTGLTFSVTSYKNLRNLTLNADSNLIASRGDAQALLDGVYNYFNILINYSGHPHPR